MEVNSMSLSRQIDFVFRQLEGELTNATAGSVHIQIRNNAIGKFGMKHHPITCKDGKIEEVDKGMSVSQVQSFRQMATDALRFRKDWTHGEIIYDFSVRASNNSWSASILFESNYNMATWNNRFVPQARNRMNLRDYN